MSRIKKDIEDQQVRNIYLARLRAHVKRTDILNYYNNQCQECGTKEKLHIHHKSYEGNSINELLVLCAKCHKKLHKRIGKVTPPQHKPMIIPVSFKTHQKAKYIANKLNMTLRYYINYCIDETNKKYPLKNMLICEENNESINEANDDEMS